jgi:hypothetical protein
MGKLEPCYHKAVTVKHAAGCENDMWIQVQFFLKKKQECLHWHGSVYFHRGSECDTVTPDNKCDIGTGILEMRTVINIVEPCN